MSTELGIPTFISPHAAGRSGYRRSCIGDGRGNSPPPRELCVSSPLSLRDIRPRVSGPDIPSQSLRAHGLALRGRGPPRRRARRIIAASPDSGIIPRSRAGGETPARDRRHGADRDAWPQGRRRGKLRFCRKKRNVPFFSLARPDGRNQTGAPPRAPRLRCLGHDGSGRGRASSPGVLATR